MRVLIVGAAGPLGQELVREALKQNHEVTALVRHEKQLAGLRDQRLTITEADVLLPGALDRAMTAQEAVICSLGVKVTRHKVTVFSEGTLNLIRAMQRHNVRRLLCITGIGAGNSRGHGGFFYNRVIQPFFLKTIYQDKDRQEKLVAESGLDWMLIRPAVLTNGKALNRFSVVEKMRGLQANKISRADAAEWTIAQLENDKYLYRAVVLTE